MYIPIEQASPEFMQRYNAIMNREEVIDTVAKLKDFLLFAIDQGWKNYERREWTAKLAGMAIYHSPVHHWITFDNIGSVLFVLEGCEVLPYEEEDAEKISDQAWLFVQHRIEDIRPEEFVESIDAKVPEEWDYVRKKWKFEK